MRIFINNNIYLFILILLYTINITLSLLVEENQPCNTERDILLATDPSHNPQAYLKCVSANIGTIGFWNKKFCTPDKKFDFASQSCIDNTNNNGITFNFNSFKSYPTTTNQGNLYNPTFEENPQPIPETPLKVAILNNTCTNGETCIGGTVCDEKKGKCLCPFGTFPNVATLSCDNDEGSPIIVSSVQEKDGTFKFTFRKQNPYSQNINDLIMKKDGENNFNKIDSIDIKNIPTTSTVKPFTFLESLFSKPGEKCSDGKICTGGSLCITSSMLCLCPGTLIEKDGECVNPSNGVPAVEKVKVGGLCNAYTECLDDSSCILGRCRCVLPLIEVNGKCILKMARKEVGPGEVCENGEICTKGSICDSTIPVCICPSGTDLNENEECVPVIVTSKVILPSTIKNIPIIIQTTPRPVTFSTTSRPITFPTTQKFIYQTIKKNNEYYTQPTIMVTTTQPPTTTTIPFTTTSKTIINTIYTQPTNGYTKLSKPLSIGAKFLKVGEICSLNTDCMIGAYCNGNSSPPSCQCLSTHVNVNGKCEKVIYPGQYGCKSDIQCSTSYPGASCHDRQCVCPLNYRAVEQTCVSGYYGGSSIKKLKKNNLMLKKVVKRQVKIQSISEFYKTNEYKNQLIMSKKYLEESSNRDDFVCLPGQFTCAKNNGVCYQSICYCFEGYYPDYQKSECLPIVNQFEEPKNVGTYVELGNNCKIHIDRCLGGSFCDPATSICSCPKGSIISKSNNTCLQPPGNSCAKGEICTNGSFCDFGVCLCLPSHHIVNNFCVIKIVPLNGICLSGERCMPGLVCHFGRCTNDVIEKRKDIKSFKNNLPKSAISRIGEKCLVSENCYGNSLCLDGFCKCQQNIEYEVDGSCKRLMKPITCPIGQIENEGSCIEEKGNETPSKNEIFSKIKKQENFRLPIPGEICTDKCGSGAFCNNGICQCPPTSVVDFFGRCKSILSTSSQSTKHRSPSLIHSTTILKTKIHSLPGESCLVEETNCLGYSICKNSICSCPDGKVLQGNVCLDGGKNFPQIIIRKLEYDDRVFNEGEIECNENDKDYDINVREASCPGGMKCYKNKCLCDIGYTLKEGECQLNEAGSLIENEECAYTVQCVDNLTCLNGFSTDRLISPPGGSCGDDETCTGGSICKNDWCVCPEINMIVINGLCLTSDILASTKVFEVPTTIQTPQKQSNMEYNQIIPQPDINIPSKYSQMSNTNDLPTFVETIQSKVEQPTVQEVKLGGRKVAPGMNCGPLDVCVGGSSCFDNYCVCPTGLIVDTNSGRCITPDDNEENSAEDKTGTLSYSIKTYKNNNIPNDISLNNNINNNKNNNLSKNKFNINNSVEKNDKSLLTENTIPLPSKQLYIIRRPSSSYNSLTTSFLSSIPGIDIHDMMPKIIKHNITDISDKIMLSNQITNTKDSYNNINNFNTIPTFANIFSKIISNNNNSYLSPETINENNLVTSNEFNKESYIGDKMSSLSNTNTNNNNNQPSKITLSSSSSNDDECIINGLICRGGAICVDGSCQCPKNYILLNDQCLPPTGRRYSQRRGKPNFLLEDNVALPNESCSNGETCLGGSICQDEKVFNMTKLFQTNKICQCPNDKNNIVDGVCVNDNIKEKYYGVGEECSIDRKCTSNAECHQGLCRCMAGYIAISNDCIQLPTAQSQSITNNAPNSDDSMKTLNSGYGSTGQIGHSDDEKPKPRFVAPSIRRPKNNSKKSKNGGISTMNGEGTCPPGNSPTRDESTNRVISCNGMTPNCPPRSYCYVTGPADGNYNCCKSF
uniref:Chitin-binding type-2 domain-containing protein n=1 Tax=Strongyloides papillosus TaxID=174720 RepID=A0A0N5CHY2_STREA